MKNKSKNPEVRIKKMAKSDLPSLLKIGNEFWEFQEWLTIDHLKNSFNQPGLSFVAEIQNKTVGGIILVFDDIAKNWIRFLVVDKKYQKCGIGRLLMQTIVSKLKKGENVYLDTGIANKKAIGFYEKMGFKNRGTVRKLYGKYGACFLEKKVE